jgi:hypothetical protein
MEGEENPEPQEEEVKLIELTQADISANLSQIDKTYDGSSYVYTTLELIEKDPKIQVMGEVIEKYNHL